MTSQSREGIAKAQVLYSKLTIIKPLLRAQPVLYAEAVQKLLKFKQNRFGVNVQREP